MRVIQVTATAGADGHLRLDIPTGAAGARFDLAVVLQAAPDAGRTPPADEAAGSHASLAGLYGSVADESFVAPPRRMPREVSSLESH